VIDAAMEIVIMLPYQHVFVHFKLVCPDLPANLANAVLTSDSDRIVMASSSEMLRTTVIQPRTL